MRSLLALAACAAAATSAHADGRIRQIAYDPNAVVRLEGCFGFQTMVEFGADERIENVGLGEASQWLVSPNKRANMLFVKPAYRSTHSNMTVSTDRRLYAFELVAQDGPACRRGAVVYALRFAYKDAPVVETSAPAPPPEPAFNAPEVRNTAYTFTGARENVPMRVFDNGQGTYFRWAEGTTTPAVFAVSGDQSESLVSFSAKGDYLVADVVAPAFILRRGNAVAVLHNDAYQTPALDAASPQPRPGKVAQNGQSGLFGKRKASQ